MPGASGGDKSRLVTCLGTSVPAGFAQRVWRSKARRPQQSRPGSVPTSPRPQASRGVAQGSANTPPARVKQRTEKLGNWACELNAGACQLVLLHSPDL